MKTIPLHEGKLALVDDEDLPRVAAHTWHVAYNSRGQPRARTQIHGRHVLMHRFIMGITDPAIQVDHENHNTLDNRRSNLRASTSSQNHGNMRRPTRNSSGYKGVHWRKDTGRWWARIGFRGKKVSLGYFPDSVDAALAYDKAARAMFGPFAHLNFPRDLP